MMSNSHRASFSYRAFNKSVKEIEAKSRQRPGSAKSSRSAKATKSTDKRRPKKKGRPASASSRRNENKQSIPTHDLPAGSGFAALRGKTRAATHESTRIENETLNETSPINTTGTPVFPISADVFHSGRFKHDCKLLVDLWEELRIPMRDREFFYRAYCRHDTAENRVRVESQLDLVRRHRENTLRVLEAIVKREAALSTIQKVMSEMPLTVPRSNIATPPTQTSFETFVTYILALREASARVINRIELWRKDMWRPQPFVWKGINYLIKISNDTSFFLDNYNIAALDTQYGFTVVDRHFFLDCGGRETNETLNLSSQERDRLNDLAKVVMVEHALQREVYSESKRLLRSGYYIPLLRWSPEDRMVVFKGNGKRITETHDDERGNASIAGDGGNTEQVQTPSQSDEVVNNEEQKEEVVSSEANHQIKTGADTTTGNVTVDHDDAAAGPATAAMQSNEVVMEKRNAKNEKEKEVEREEEEEGYSDDSFSDGETKAREASAQHMQMLEQVRKQL